MDCPICLDQIQSTPSGSTASEDRTEARCGRATRRRVAGRDAFAFPCGHRICNSCNERMLQRNNLVCPLCRTPREGISSAEAARASEFQALVDRQHEVNEPPTRRDDDPFQSAVADGVGVGGLVQRGGRRYEVLFFVNQSTGDPTEPLDSAARRLQERVFSHNNRLFSSSGNSNSSNSRAARRQRRARASPLGPRRAETLNAQETEQQAEQFGDANGDDAEDDGDDGITMLHRPFEIPASDVNLNLLIGHLLSPTSMNTFLAARERV